MDLQLSGLAFNKVHGPVYRWIEEKTPESVLGDVQIAVGEVVTNCWRHGKDSKIVVNLYYDPDMCGLVVDIIAESHVLHFERLSMFLFGRHPRRYRGMLLSHGRGLDMVVHVADKVTLGEDGCMRLYFACMSSNSDLARAFDDARDSLFNG